MINRIAIWSLKTGEVKVEEFDENVLTEDISIKVNYQKSFCNQIIVASVTEFWTKEWKNLKA